MAGHDDGWFSMLPDELCLHIFQYLPARDVCTCMRVCRRLNALCNDASLWTQVTVPCWYVTSALLHKLSSTWPHLHTIILYDNSEDEISTWEDLSKEWAQFKYLETIALLRCPSVVLDTLQNIIKCCPSLKCVICPSISFGREHFLALMTSGQSYTELTLHNCIQIDDDAVHYVCQTSPTALDHLSSLQVLDLDSLQLLTDVGILPILQACSNLKSLDIGGSQLTDRTGLFIGQHLLGLERLSIFSCSHMTDGSLLSFAALKNLRQLCLKGSSHFTSKGLEMFFLQLAANKDSEPDIHPEMDTLELTEFEDHIDSPLLVLGQKFPGLRHLDLSSCSELTAAGLDAIARHCMSLVTLRLDYVKCPHHKPILGMAFPQLRYLSLYLSDLLDDEEMQQLKRTRPWLEIDAYIGLHS